MKTEERATRIVHEIESIYVSFNPDYEPRKRLILSIANALADARRAALDILSELAHTDPVYGPIASRDKAGKLISVRKCALCREESGDNEENVRHTYSCPWIPAQRFVKENRAAGAP